MQLIPVVMVVATLASETVTSSSSESRQAALLRNAEPPAHTSATLSRLPLVPKWSQLLLRPGDWPPGVPAWRIEPQHEPVRRLTMRAIYATLAKLPTLDRVGRFAHIDFPMPGLSAGAELLRNAPDPPREDYPKAQELTPGWGWWYKPRGDRWAVGIVTSTRFLIAEQSGAAIDPFTSEARCAFFLP